MDKNLMMFKALSDRTRLAIVKALMEKRCHVEELSDNLGVTPSTVSFHLKKLVEADMITSVKEQYYTVFTIKPGILEKNLGQLIRMSASPCGEENKYRLKVERAFFKYGKLIQIPVGRKKRRIVLDIIAEAFKPGKKYTEKEVNLIIADFHDDFCFIRRAMIEEKMMAREKGIYWMVEK